jgi:diguanylate cyclase (GGDEF)-like protein/PAS domain S-box-containing protein
MPGPPFSGLRARLVGLVLLAALPAFGLALVTDIEERRATGTVVRENTLLVARLASANHQRLFEVTRQFLATLTQLPEVRGGGAPECNALLARLLHQHPLYADFGVVSPQGQLVCSSVPTSRSLDRRGQAFFRRALQERAFTAGEVEVTGIPARPTLAFGYPMLAEDNDLRGVVYANLDLSWLQDFAATARLPKGGVLLLLDGAGTVLGHDPEPRRFVGQSFPDAPIVREVLQRRGEGVTEAPALDGATRLFAFAPLQGASGIELYVCVGIPVHEAYGEANHRLVRNLAGLGVVMLLAIGLTWAAGDVFVLRRLTGLVEATTGLATGQLGARSGLADEPGPLGTLAREFDDMAETLEKRQGEMQRTASELRKSEARKTAILEGALDAVITMDGEGRILEFNPAAEATFGYTRAEALGQRAEDLIVPDNEKSALGLAGFLVGRDTQRRIEAVARRKDGSEFPVEVSVTPIRDPGAPLFTAFLRDITERKSAEEELRAARDELQKRIEMRTAELKDANARLVDWVEELQQRAQDMRQLSEVGDHLQACHTVEEAYAVIGQYGRSLFPDEPGALCMLDAGGTLVETVATWGNPTGVEDVFSPEDCWALRRGKPHLVEGPETQLVCRHLGTPPPTAYVCVPMMAQGTALGILILVESPGPGATNPGPPDDAVRPAHTLARRQLGFTVADQLALSLSNLRLQETLRDQAIRDPLTGLFNRRYMEESLEREMRRAERRDVPLGVMMLDIDHFKRFNDSFGHAAGDTALREIGRLLQEHTRGEDIACRYGGEEFTLILLDATLPFTLERAAALREQAGKLRLRHGSQSLGSVTLSLGVAVYPDHGRTAEELLRAADAALYRAKEQGRDRVVAAAPVEQEH